VPKGDIAIKAGTLRHVVNIMQPVLGPVGVAGSTTTYQLYAGPIPAAIEPASARDVIRSGQTVSQVVIPITIRWMPGMNQNGNWVNLSGQFRIQRLESWQGSYQVVAVYEVQGVLNADERNWKVTLACIALGLNQ
jgi:head-tail adaptor